METEQKKKKKAKKIMVSKNKPANISIHQHDVKLICTIE
jgi:hypothetical protein